MKNTLLAILILCSFSSFSQGKNDMTDTRKQSETFARVHDQALRADLASFNLAGIDESVNKATLRKIPFTSSGPDFMNFEGDSIKATVTTATFDGSKHKLEYDEKWLIRIDKKTYYGGYGVLPKKVISKVTIVVGKDSIAIPPAAYNDLYNLNLAYNDKSGVQRSTNGVYRSKDGHRIYFYLFCKDNTGSYEVTWVIQDKKYLRRVLDFGFM